MSMGLKECCLILIFSYKFVALSLLTSIESEWEIEFMKQINTFESLFCVRACAACPRHDSTNKKITANYIYYTFVRSFTHWASIVAFNGNEFRSVSHNCMLFSCMCVSAWKKEKNSEQKPRDTRRLIDELESRKTVHELNKVKRTSNGKNIRFKAHLRRNVCVCFFSSLLSLVSAPVIQFKFIALFAKLLKQMCIQISYLFARCRSKYKWQSMKMKHQIRLNNVKMCVCW